MPSSVVYVAGMPITPAAAAGAAGLVCDDAAAGRARVYVLVNAHSAKLRRDSAPYADVLYDPTTTVGLSDGASITAVARVLGYGKIGRSAGPDLFEVCCAQCAREGLRVFLLGGGEGVAGAAAESLTARLDDLLIAGMATPPFGEWSEDENLRLVNKVRDSGAQVLWLGVSAPKQEIWAHRFVESLGVPVVCVGAAFDFAAGVKPRAPEWMRRAGIEWVHRLAIEPRRMWKRYLVGNALFIFDALRYGRKPARGSGRVS